MASLVALTHTNPQLKIGPSIWLPKSNRKNPSVSRQLKKLKNTCKSLRNEMREKDKKLRKLSEEIILVEFKERNRIAQLLHSDLQQQLFIISLSINSLQQDLGDDLPASIQEEFDSIFSYIETAAKTIRELAIKLHVPSFKNNSINEAMKWLDMQLKKQYKTNFSFQIEDDINLPDRDFLLQIIMIIKELLFNVSKHTGNPTADIEISKFGNMIRIRVADKGPGFDPKILFRPERTIGTLGLRNLMQLIPLNDGKIHVDSAPGKSTIVSIALKVPA